MSFLEMYNMDCSINRASGLNFNHLSRIHVGRHEPLVAHLGFQSRGVLSLTTEL
jgi:hypothetical protein